MKFYDAHNHMQVEGFADRQAEVIAEAKSVGLVGMVVNGICENDWASVEQLAKDYADIYPSYGLHPWFHHERSTNWLDLLSEFLIRSPSGVGELGLDRYKEGLPYEEQEGVFLEQWKLAARLNRPASIHCLKASGKLLELLKANTGPECGFLLHSYSGSVEMVPDFVKLGAYFSFPGYYALGRKQRQRETFKEIPLDRLLIETDAPDQSLPDEINRFPIKNENGKPMNHPANIAAVYDVVADLRGMPLQDLADQVEENFKRLFARIV